MPLRLRLRLRPRFTLLCFCRVFLNKPANPGDARTLFADDCVTLAAFARRLPKRAADIVAGAADAAPLGPAAADARAAPRARALNVRRAAFGTNPAASDNRSASTPGGEDARAALPAVVLATNCVCTAASPNAFNVACPLSNP